MTLCTLILTLHLKREPRRTQWINEIFIFAQDLISQFSSCLDGDCGGWASDVGLVANGHGDDGEAVGGPRLHALLDKVKLVPGQP